MPLSASWLLEFRKTTEGIWATKELNPSIYGFQIQRGTKWLPGLADEQIDAYEQDLGFKFDPDLRLFLSKMNGFDRPGLNLYGSSGEAPCEAVICYRYPQDIALIRELRKSLEEDWDEMTRSLEIELIQPINFVPVYSHRFVLCPPNKPVVCSIVGTDAIVYGDSLQSYLAQEFLT